MDPGRRSRTRFAVGYYLAALSAQLDTVMVQFKNTQPEFYAKYQSARAVVDVAARASKDDEAKSSATPTAKAA